MPARRAGRPGRHELLCRAGKPDVGPVPIHEGRHVLHEPLLGQKRAALGAVQDRDGNTPGALARDAPVGPVGDHAVDPLLAPGGNPLHLLADRGERALPQPALLHRDEPLVGGAEEDRVLAAPAVRIRMLELFGVEQRAVRPQLGDDRGVGLPHVHAGEMLDLGDEPSGVVHRIVDRQAALDSRLVVIRAMAGRGVHTPGPRVHGHIFGREDRGRTVQPGVPRRQAVESTPPHTAHNRRRLQPALASGLLEQLLSQNEAPIPRANDDVFLVGMNHDGEIGRQGPGCRGPDHHRDPAPGESRIQGGRVGRQRKGDVD
jgi:hypothetical protein